jgi:hypothetical protein
MAVCLALTQPGSVVSRTGWRPPGDRGGARTHWRASVGDCEIGPDLDRSLVPRGLIAALWRYGCLMRKSGPNSAQGRPDDEGPRHDNG